ncbi:E3 ubiquitin ligase BIG BROTHER-related-like [Prosopis cineraria]|uniref:E3 ubiquitin ligase BIG BROTHER-related-like n=1 Tax=Prosopis cineraria TaxID=364024 RepID=UPI00240E9DC1|nr:E3 ubiquitin ligase BIG BROTHER-related-like [Prosopis cineraria]XP_054795193.1 E3 ubiquitin ligase BIG BROTHER-related-like [Prosopis cineraria]
MEPEEGKQSSHKTPYTELEQVNSDFTLAIALQEQEGTFTRFATMDSEESGNEDESESSFEDEDDDEYADFSESQEFELGDLQFLEGEGSNDEEMEEDEIDPDELSYEELIELGEFIGEERRGLSANEIPCCLHPYTCHFAENKTGIDRCVICQVEYEEGQALMALQCEHPYHSECITKWLQIKKVCPICSTEVLHFKAD